LNHVAGGGEIAAGPAISHAEGHIVFTGPVG
jgi:hypothetical protein